MKRAKRAPTLELETLLPILIKEWRRYIKLNGPDERLQTREFRGVVAAVKEIEKRIAASEDLFDDRSLLGAYILYRWILHYQQGISLINEIAETPTSVLDICSGPGAFAFAALKHGASDVTAIDKNIDALQLGANICGRSGYPMAIHRWDLGDRLPSKQGGYDLIIVGHSLRELFPDHKRGWRDDERLFTLNLLDLLSPKGHLLLVDDSWPAVNTRFLQLRDALTQAGAKILAPCLWQGECPALKAKNSPCYAQRTLEKPFLISEIQRAAEINLGSVKMSYLILKSPKAPAARAKEEQPLYRVISPPAQVYTGKRYYLCGYNGKRRLESHFKEQPKAARAFDFLERGALIAVNNPLVNGSTLNIIEGTEVSVVAAPGKAVPES